MESKLYRPIRPNGFGYKDNYYHRTTGGSPPSTVGQFYGENKACKKPDGTIISIWESQCPVGTVSVYKDFGLDGHNGLDIACMRGEPIFAAHDGTISRIEGDKNCGYGVRVVSDDKYALKHDFDAPQALLESIYWHVIPLFVVKEGAKVKTGQLIAFADSTGYSSGDHLHFGLKAKSDTGATLYTDNGYKGALDPLPYIEEKDAYDVWKEKQTLLARKAVELIILYYQVIIKMKYGGRPIDFDESLICG